MYGYAKYKQPNGTYKTEKVNLQTGQLVRTNDLSRNRGGF